ncbi:unnamed protein product, partial [Protopolystoma xenopodis]
APAGQGSSNSYDESKSIDSDDKRRCGEVPISIQVDLVVPSPKRQASSLERGWTPSRVRLRAERGNEKKQGKREQKNSKISLGSVGLEPLRVASWGADFNSLLNDPFGRQYFQRR